MKKKLIEVALPLEAINVASAKEKSIRHGHPSTLHLWWARRPLAACRAVLFASIVNDPSSEPERFPTEELQEAERQRLFRIIEELVKWENTTNETVLNAARAEIMRATDGNPPPVLDPFCGGGSIPLEAQRLGLEAHGSDLNPVAVLITKALIEIPPKFANQPPVHPIDPGQGTFAKREWRGAQGLAEDVRYYGKWMRDEAERRIGHLYPKATLPDGSEATVIAWIWARTVECPNPACGAQMPLVRSFVLSQKPGAQAWIEPFINRVAKSVGFLVRTDAGPPVSGTVGRRGARCLVCETTVQLDYIRSQGKSGLIGSCLMATVAEGKRGRHYLSANDDHAIVARSAIPNWIPDVEMPHNPFSVRPPLYGLRTYADVFSARQLVALDTFSVVLSEARKQIESDLKINQSSDRAASEDSKGSGGTLSYPDAVATYLAFAIDKGVNYWSSLCAWHSSRDIVMSTFARQALPMVWDYAEINPFSNSTGNFILGVEQAVESLRSAPANIPGEVKQLEAGTATRGNSAMLISTDPPYYNNVDYADLSDYFYVWLRRSLSTVYPGLFSTLLTPKEEELVATPYRFHGDKSKAQDFFEQGLREVFISIHDAQHKDYPLTVFYAFKQSETAGEADENLHSETLSASTGWETMLTGLLTAKLMVVGTWPMRTELTSALKGHMSVLASSIVLVCRPRSADARPATRQEFLRALKSELPNALKILQHGNVAPVDLAQAAIGPGMAIFSRHSRVVESDGKPMRVRTALQLINQILDEVLTEQEGEYDGDTRWALAWFDQHAHDDGLFGQADVLARAKNSSVNGLVEAGIVASRGGKVRLLRRDELPADWNPVTDTRLTIWETAQQLIRALDTGGEVAAATLLQQIGPAGETARDLAYRLYTTCERKGWAAEARAYNSLVVAWPQITQRSSEPSENEQMRLV